MNSSILKIAIFEQLFCNEKVNSNNEPCYGISTVSGLQRAVQQGQKIYQIDSKNRDQLKNIAMSDENMADDINKAIASGGYVIVPEKAVDDTGRNAIYVYMTYNGQSGYQSWKISGGLNGGFLKHLSNIGKKLLNVLSLIVGTIADYTPDFLKYIIKNIYEKLKTVLDYLDRIESYLNAGCSSFSVGGAILGHFTLMLIMSIFATFITAGLSFLAFIPVFGIPLLLSISFILGTLLSDVVSNDYDAAVVGLCSRKKRL